MVAYTLVSTQSATDSPRIPTCSRPTGAVLRPPTARNGRYFFGYAMATKPWSDVASSDAFKQLSPTDQAAARRQYFDTVVAPQVPDNDRQAAWQQFDSDTASRAQALPAGIRPSQAGGGRGSINPPADAPFRVDVTGTAADEQPAARSNGLAPLPPEGLSLIHI